MNFVVVDTNVPVVSNGNSKQAKPACVTACIDRLQTALGERIVIDDGFRILKEYENNLPKTGQPGPGHAFLKHVFVNIANQDVVEQVSITPAHGNAEDYEEFPRDPRLDRFDRSDRKFVAVAMASGGCPPIINAVDSDWWNHRDALSENGITVEFLCPDYFDDSVCD